jgi:hypothetical protein
MMSKYWFVPYFVLISACIAVPMSFGVSLLINNVGTGAATIYIACSFMLMITFVPMVRIARYKTPVVIRPASETAFDFRYGTGDDDPFERDR